jgi:hypothetical protein
MAKLIVAFRSNEIEQYGAKVNITFKSAISTAVCFAVVDKSLKDQGLKHLAVASLDG